jgi:acyl carrier protein
MNRNHREGYMESVEAILRDYIAENILFSENGFIYEESTSFLENGILDSMSIMDLVLFAEKEFSVSISDSEITPDNFDSIEKLSGFIRGKQSE